MKLDYKSEVFVKAPVDASFEAIANDLQLWWGKTSGMARLDDSFKVFFRKAFWEFKIIEYQQDKSIVWECIDGKPQL